MKLRPLIVALGSAWQVVALVFGLLAIVWGYYLGSHGGAGAFYCGVARPEYHRISNLLDFTVSAPNGDCTSYGWNDGTSAVLVLAGLVAVIVVASRNIPRRLSERVGGSVPRVWR